MKQQYIRLSDVLDQMDELDENSNPVRFQMKFVTANRKLDTGGEIIEIIDGKKCIGVRHGKIIFDKRVKPERSGNILTKDPNHWANSTRNIMLPNGLIRKVHIRLIIEFNHKKVCF